MNVPSFLYKKRLLVYMFMVFLLQINTYAHADSVKKETSRTDINKAELANFVQVRSNEVIGEEFDTDLNEDGKPEHFIGVVCGNGGCQYYCFENMGDEKYRFIGLLVFQREGFEILKTKHDKFNDILNYSHTGTSTGTLTRYEFDGQMYKVKESVKDVDARVYKLLRPTQLATQTKSDVSFKKQITSMEPAFTIQEALAIAQDFIQKNSVDISKQYINSITLHYDEGLKRKGLYWRIQWVWSAPRIGGEYGLRVYMDGKAIPEPSGP